MGDLYRDRGDLAAASEYYRQYLSVVYDGTTGCLHWAGAYLAAELPNEAEAVLSEALAQRPGSAPLRAGLGDVYRAQGRTEEAVAAYQAALEADPNLTTAYLGSGLARPDRGDLARGFLPGRDAGDRHRRDTGPGGPRLPGRRLAG